MKRSLSLVWPISFFSALIILLAGTLIFVTTRLNNDLQPLTIAFIQKSDDSRIVELEKNKKYEVSFTSYADNLGQVALFFDTHNRENKDHLRFQIRETGAVKSYYDNLYRADHFLTNKWFPFGFPVIQNSKKNNYTVTLQSIDASPSSHLAVSAAGIISKYTYTKSVLKNPSRLVGFLFLKMWSLIHNAGPGALFVLIIPSAILLLFRNKNIYKTVIGEWRYFVKAIIERVGLSKFLSWRRRGEIELVLFSVYLFWYSIAVHQPSGKPYLIMIHIPFAYFAYRAARYVASHIKNLTGHFPVLIPLAVFTAIRLAFFDFAPHWDGLVYFNELSKSVAALNPTLDNLATVFLWINHPTVGYSAFMSIGQLFTPHSVILIHVQDMLLGIFAILAFYGIVRSVFKENALISSFYTLIFAVNPLFIAVSLYPNLDYPVLCYFVIALYFLFADRMILFAFFSSLMVLSKEVGLMLYVQFLFFLLLGMFTFRSTVLSRYTDRLKNSQTRSFLLLGYLSYLFLPIIIFGLQFLLSDGATWQGNYYVTPHVPFLYHSMLFFPKFYEAFVLNFTWLMMLVFLGSVAKWRKQLHKNVILTPTVVVLFFSWLSFVAVNCFYNTFPHPRYLAVTAFFTSVFFLYGVVAFNPKKRLILTLATCILLFVSVFTTIDPISRIAFGTIKWGNKNLLKIGDDLQSRGDSMIYNTEYVYIDRLYRDFSKLNVDNRRVVLSTIPGTGWAMNWWMQNYKYGPQIPPEMFDTKQLPQNAYYLFLPWLSNNTDYDIKQVRQFYEVGEEKTISASGYWLKYYELRLKKSK